MTDQPTAVERAETACTSVRTTYADLLEGWSWTVQLQDSTDLTTEPHTTVLIRWEHPLSGGFIQEHPTDRSQDQLLDSLRKHFVEMIEVQALAELAAMADANHEFLAGLRGVSLALRLPDAHLRAIRGHLLAFGVINAAGDDWLRRYGTTPNHSPTRTEAG